MYNVLSDLNLVKHVQCMYLVTIHVIESINLILVTNVLTVVTYYW